MDTLNSRSKINNLTNVDFGKLVNEKNELVIKIFNSVKLHEWNKVKNIIETSSIDLNIKDTNGTYLLEYVVMFNQIELVELLLDRGVRIDIVDDSSRSFLYNVIKFSHIQILVKVLEKNKNSIGKSILEIKDNNGNIPLFYSIKFYNTECVNILIKYTNNFYIKNNDGDNALHLSIKSQNFELFKLILDNFNDFKSRNNFGESYLHLIVKYKCYDMLKHLINNYHSDTNFIQMLNFVDHKYNFSILHYISVGLDYESLNIISKSNLVGLIDGNIQDNSGNIFYHYFINNVSQIHKPTATNIENIVNMNEIFKKINFNINLYNVDGNTPAHLFFSLITYFSSNKLNVLINWIGEKADMNIQNFEGESVFYLIVKNNYWKQIYNILITKKLDIFVMAENDNIVFDYIENTDYSYFLKMITHSYLYQLSNLSASKKWLDYWDNRCKKIVKLSELNETEYDLLKNLGISGDKISKDQNICFNIVEKKLNRLIQIFIQNKKTDYLEFTSYPITHKFKKLMLSYPNVIISSFSGSTIDVLCGLIYLTKKFSNPNKNNIISSMIFIENKENIIDCKSLGSSHFVDKLANNNDSNNKVCEISGFEILWTNKNIYFPSSNTENIETILKKIVKTNTHNDKFNWFVIPIGIELENYSHANYLIIDMNKMEIERFEPHGSKPPIGLNYDANMLDFVLENYFNEFDLGFQYVKPDEFLPNIGFQMKEINELKSDYIGDPNGFCALWCIWWCDLRLSNPDIPREKLVKYVNRELINGKYSYKKLIRDYSWYITDIRDKLFLKANTNINEWINDTIQDKNLELLNNAIRDEIINIVQS